VVRRFPEFRIYVYICLKFGRDRDNDLASLVNEIRTIRRRAISRAPFCVQSHPDEFRAPTVIVLIQARNIRYVCWRTRAFYWIRRNGNKVVIIILTENDREICSTLTREFRVMFRSRPSY